MSQCKTALHQGNKCWCGNCFNIYHGEFGVLISAPAPLEDCARIMQLYADLFDYDICDALIASHTKSAMALTTREKGALWRKELKIDHL